MKNKSDFILALKNEISLQNDFISSPEPIETIYFGGGTPSLLTLSEIDSILSVIQKKYTINTDVEITLEANPDDINTSTVKEWMGLGINRLSLGVQSFVDKELAWMNRAHNSQDSLKSIDIILEAGITNFSVDLIFGSPLLSDSELEKNIRYINERGIPHISCYALTIEPKTALHHFIQQKKGVGIDPEKQAAQFLLTMDLLNSFGYEQYEISNYSKAGMRSKHNSSYWQGKPYLGFGPSAHSFDGKDKRRWNIANNMTYINELKKHKIPFEEEVLTTAQRFNEYVMISLRRIEGIDKEFVLKNFGSEILTSLVSSCESFINNKRLELMGNNITLTREGKLFADGIASELFLQ